MNIEIRRFFRKIINNSLTSQQVNFLGEQIDPAFNLNRAAGYRPNLPVPRQTAANALLQYFSEDDEIVRLFSIMIQHEGERFYNRELSIWGREDFISLLKKYKWIYDDVLMMFFLDPFYEHDINFLKKIRVIDLRTENNVDEITSKIADVCKKMSIADLEWRVVMRLYDLERNTGELIRKIISMLLSRQNLQALTPELFVCIKELVINASKANYKILFEKYITAPEGLTSESNYHEFLSRFRDEIDENGNRNLFELAKKSDRFISMTFQSTLDSIEMWVTNNQNISSVEKQQILKRLGMNRPQADSFFDIDDDLTEGAGMGINLVLKILTSYSIDPHPLKVVFYPDTVKIGFSLNRAEIQEKIQEKNNENEQDEQG
ncbi:MAG TPA: hypothetical protein PK926_16375 [Spirochaetota bacterium]|nr:hypothetical protein [Spirochaetota bacterium]HPI90443.1 hypothetical protein [Spirochaetota bacterium]HPR49352.1 hypothetical protein [Spirochaetota bacterium]